MRRGKGSSKDVATIRLRAFRNKDFLLKGMVAEKVRSPQL